MRDALPRPPPPPDARRVLKVVADEFGVRVAQIVGGGRFRTVARPRQIAAYLMRERLDMSYPQIGDLLGGRDHSTIISACRAVTKLLGTDDKIVAKVDAICARLDGTVSSAQEQKRDEESSVDVRRIEPGDRLTLPVAKSQGVGYIHAIAAEPGYYVKAPGHPFVAFVSDSDLEKACERREREENIDDGGREP